MFDLKSNCQTSCLTALAGEPVADKRQDKIIQPALWQPLTVETLKGVCGGTHNTSCPVQISLRAVKHTVKTPKVEQVAFFPSGLAAQGGRDAAPPPHCILLLSSKLSPGEDCGCCDTSPPMSLRSEKTPNYPPPASLYLTPKPSLGFRAGDSNRGPWGAAEERAAARSPPQPPLSPWRRRAGPHGPAA